jgi:hypothetical protein
MSVNSENEFEGEEQNNIEGGLRKKRRTRNHHSEQPRRKQYKDILKVGDS